METQEIWKDIPGYEGIYQVSNLGRVRSLNIKILKTFLDNAGYLCFHTKDLKNYRVHRLMAEVFIPNPNNLSDLNHRDECKTNNFVWVNEDGSVDLDKSNLEWLSHRDNINYGTAQERRMKSYTEGRCSHKIFKRKVAQYSLNGTLIAIYSSITEAAEATGAKAGNIVRCCRGTGKTTRGFIWEYTD